MIKNDLRFLLKEKYNISEYDIEKYIEFLDGLDLEVILNENAFDLDRVEKSIKKEKENENGNKKDLFNLKKSNLPQIDNIAGDYISYMNGYPLAYIIGYVDFINVKIDLSYKTLIPRPETEYWVNEFINEHKEEKKLDILDIFSGSGCIGIAILKNIPNSFVTFSDISDDAVKQIQKNLKLNEIDSNRYKVIKSDMFAKFKKDYKADYILANPPYVGRNDMQSEGIIHEPEVAIFSENDGLNETEMLIKEADRYFMKKLYVEMSEFRKEEIEKLVIENKYTNYDFQKDQYGKDRLLIISKNKYQ